MRWIVRLSDGWWLEQCRGGYSPATTDSQARAERFWSRENADLALRICRCFAPFPDGVVQEVSDK